jgi:hypothetical protein
VVLAGTFKIGNLYGFPTPYNGVHGKLSTAGVTGPVLYDGKRETV